MATPLPTNGSDVTIVVDPSLLSSHAVSRVQVHAKLPVDTTVRYTLFDAEPHFFLYALPSGIVRIFAVPPDSTTLVKTFKGWTVRTVQCSMAAGCAGIVAGDNNSNSSSFLVIRVQQPAPGLLQTVDLVELQSATVVLDRVVWHPVDMNKLYLLHNRGATLVETTRLVSTPRPTGGVLCLLDSTWWNHQQATLPVTRVQDLVWSTVHGVWMALVATDNKVQCYNGTMLQEELVLDDDNDKNAVDKLCRVNENCFLTIQSSGTLTLWSNFPAPCRLQTVRIPHQRLLTVAAGCCFTTVTAPDATSQLYVWRLLLDGGLLLESVAVFACLSEIRALAVEKKPDTVDTTEDEYYSSVDEADCTVGSIRVIAHQARVVQSFTLEGQHLALSTMSAAGAVTLEPRSQPAGVHLKGTVVGGGLQFDEEYDVNDDDDDTEEDDFEDAVSPPDPSALPTPAGFASGFGNWLGALATSNKDAKDMASPPPTTPQVQTQAAPPPPPPSDPAIVSTLPPELQPDLHVSLPPEILASDVPSSSSPPMPVVSAPRDTTPLTNPNAPSPSHPKASISSDEVRRIVRDELQQLQTDLSVQTQRAVTLAVNQATDAQTVGRSVEGAVQAAVARTLKTAVVPALQAVVGQVVEAAVQQIGQTDTVAATRIDTLTQQVEALSAQLVKMSAELVALKRAPAPAAAPAPASPKDMPESQIKPMVADLLRTGQYQRGFDLAVNTQKTSVVLFCCQQADVGTVLESGAPKINQIMMACLMHNLSHVIKIPGPDDELETALEWVQEIAYSLSPPDEAMSRHLKQIVGHTTTSLEARIQQPGKHKRSLMRVLQIVRGIQVQ